MMLLSKSTQSGNCPSNSARACFPPLFLSNLSDLQGVVVSYLIFPCSINLPWVPDERFSKLGKKAYGGVRRPDGILSALGARGYFIYNTASHENREESALLFAVREE